MLSLEAMVSKVEELVTMQTGEVGLLGELEVPADARGLVLFAHGSGSSRRSPRNRAVASLLREAGFGTLLIDLTSVRDEEIDASTGRLRFDVGLLAERLIDAIACFEDHPRCGRLPMGLYGARSGAGVALIAAAMKPETIGAVVSRGGRPDLAGMALARVQSPTLLIVGGEDGSVIGRNRQTLLGIAAPAKELRVVPGATHLFEEPGAIDEVARLTASWFERYLEPSP